MLRVRGGSGRTCPRRRRVQTRHGRLVRQTGEHNRHRDLVQPRRTQGNIAGRFQGRSTCQDRCSPCWCWRCEQSPRHRLPKVGPRPMHGTGTAFRRASDTGLPQHGRKVQSKGGGIDCPTKQRCQTTMHSQRRRRSSPKNRQATERRRRRLPMTRP